MHLKVEVTQRFRCRVKCCLEILEQPLVILALHERAASIRSAAAETTRRPNVPAEPLSFCAVARARTESTSAPAAGISSS